VQEDDRLALLWLWNGLVVFGSMQFLTGSLFKSALIAMFVGLSSALGYGQRWLLRGGFALAALAIAVYLDVLPPLDQWSSRVRDALSLLGFRSP
jgi:hypothetical protein